MTPTDPHTNDHDQNDALRLDPETERCHRYEITAAMNAVIRTCREAVNEHTCCGFWTPTGDNPDVMSLVRQAHNTVLTNLRMVLNCAESVIKNVEASHRECHKSSE